MRLVHVGTRHVETLSPDATARDIARLLKEHEAGVVVIMSGDAIAGLVTDRDLVMQVLAEGRDPETTLAKDIMSSDIVTIRNQDEVHDAASIMREKGVRRLPVLNREGKLVGLLTFDDLVHYFGRVQSDIADAVAEFPLVHEGG